MDSRVAALVEFLHKSGSPGRALLNAIAEEHPEARSPIHAALAAQREK
jgi:hypothetical protein